MNSEPTSTPAAVTAPAPESTKTATGENTPAAATAPAPSPTTTSSSYFTRSRFHRLPFEPKGGHAWIQKCLQENAAAAAANPIATYGTQTEPTEADLMMFVQACGVTLRFSNGQWLARLHQQEATASLPLVAVWQLYYKIVQQPVRGVWCRSLSHEWLHLVFPDGTTSCGATRPLGAQWFPIDPEDDTGRYCKRCRGHERVLNSQKPKAPKTTTTEPPALKPVIRRPTQED